MVAVAPHSCSWPSAVGAAASPLAVAEGTHIVIPVVVLIVRVEIILFAAAITVNDVCGLGGNMVSRRGNVCLSGCGLPRVLAV